MSDHGNESNRLNAMTVDVEDYFQVQAFAKCVDRDSWSELPSRVERNTMRVLEHFDRHNVHATFFTLGWVAERYPAIVKRIVASGHELASHGYGHQLVHELTPEAFREDVFRAKHLLESIGGQEIWGYRAPTFSVGPRNPWAYDVLGETGHRYSSSVYPVRHDLYGNPDAPRFAHRPTNAAVLEIPMTTLRLSERNFPISGGGYFRLMPYALYRTAFRRFLQAEDQSGMFYFHPWEIDAEQPRIPRASVRSRFRHYINIAAVPGRLDRLLQDFRWGRMDRVFAAQLASA